MFDHEKVDAKLSSESKRECAEAATVGMEAVDDVLTKHEQMASFHKWL